LVNVPEFCPMKLFRPTCIRYSGARKNISDTA
jgi:hypothetical protein